MSASFPVPAPGPFNAQSPAFPQGGFAFPAEAYQQGFTTTNPYPTANGAHPSNPMFDAKQMNGSIKAEEETVKAHKVRFWDRPRSHGSANDVADHKCSYTVWNASDASFSTTSHAKMWTNAAAYASTYRKYDGNERSDAHDAE
ncbi:hypothetical protein NECAME_04527 [Necator americanus]|uniref:Uncharacterized protein n=1 Tax=Necator americanus TaxID=51031 RepID=W2ST75_NECAM|nr:hypothetical protein NECAME_04527 [Necator americanus]ETN72056.1 hypothetical protein NECAME_04527 [Necator americanus]